MVRHGTDRALLVPAVVVVEVAGCVLAVAALVLGLATAAGREVDGATWLLAAGGVAVAVPLARPRLDALADRVVHGKAGDPYAALSDFVRAASEALAVDDVLPQLARTAAGAVGGDAGTVHLRLADGREQRSTWPPEREVREVREDLAVSVRHQGTAVGSVAVEVPPGLTTAADEEVLAQLAAPAGVALANVRLTYDLRSRLEQEQALAEQVRASRQRLLAAAHDQRVAFAAAVADRVLDPLRRARGLLVTDDPLTARAPTQAALDALRDLATGLFPPALVERGLVDALELHLQRHGLAADLDAAADLPRLPGDVEAATWACAVLLLAPGTRRVELRLDEETLHLAVLGPPPDVQLAADRAASAGGRLTVGLDRVDVHLPAVAP